MIQTPQSVLAVGDLPAGCMDELALAGLGVSACRVSAIPVGASVDRYDVVVADGSFDFYSFEQFALTLKDLRNCVKEGGSLFLARTRRSERDACFCFRNDDFFLEELPQTGLVDFAEVASTERCNFLLVEMRRRLPGAEAADRLKSLPPFNSLGRLLSFTDEMLPPTWIWAAATTRCNIRCRTCSLRGSAPGSDMSVDVVERVFAAVGGHAEIVNVTGIGEPLLSRTWPQLLAGVRARPGRFLEVVTNGLLLTEDVIREMMLPGHSTELIVSIDANTKETYEFIRDRAKWDLLVRAMDTIKRVRQELLPGDRFRLVVDFVAIKENVHELPDLIRRLAAWDVDRVMVIEMGDWITNREFFREQALRFHPQLANRYYALARNEAARHTFSMISIPPDYSQEFLSGKAGRPESRLPRKGFVRGCLRAAKGMILKYRISRRAACAVVTGLESYMRNPVAMPRTVARWMRRQMAVFSYDGFGDFARVKGFCPVVTERVYFHPDGRVVPCCGILSACFGNITERPFGEIWNSDRYKELRVMSLLGYPHTACYYCTLPYGLPQKNPENYMAMHPLPPRANALARFLRQLKRDLTNQAGGPQ